MMNAVDTTNYVTTSTFLSVVPRPVFTLPLMTSTGSNLER